MHQRRVISNARSLQWLADFLGAHMLYGIHLLRPIKLRFEDSTEGWRVRGQLQEMAEQKCHFQLK